MGRDDHVRVVEEMRLTDGTLFPIPVITLFWKEEIGMSLTEIMWLQAIFGATTVLLEFPSGYVADRLGYRRSLLTGALFWPKPFRITGKTTPGFC